MSKFCTNCGKELDENAVVCVKCGVAVNNLKTKTKQPGKGMSIASMVLGIVSIFYGICAISMTTLFSITYTFHEATFSYGNLPMAILVNLWPFASAITGLSLGVASTKKINNGFNLSGIILSSITILMCITSILIISCA